MSEYDAYYLSISSNFSSNKIFSFIIANQDKVKIFLDLTKLKLKILIAGKLCIAYGNQY